MSFEAKMRVLEFSYRVLQENQNPPITIEEVLKVAKKIERHILRGDSLDTPALVPYFSKRIEEPSNND
jgi:hypothetical protein